MKNPFKKKKRKKEYAAKEWVAYIPINPQIKSKKSKLK